MTWLIEGPYLGFHMYTNDTLHMHTDDRIVELQSETGSWNSAQIEKHSLSECLGFRMPADHKNQISVCRQSLQFCGV